MPHCSKLGNELAVNAEFIKNELILRFLSWPQSREMLARFGRQRHLPDPGILAENFCRRKPFFSSSFGWVVTKEGSTCINRDTGLTGTPFSLPK